MPFSSALIASHPPQLASRHAIYRLILEHEARRSLHCKQLGCPDEFDDADGANDGAQLFESVLFMRPDLAILVPLLPYCFHPLDTARRMGDWIVWMPRRALDGAFGRALEVFRSCAVRFENGSEKLFDELAASSNVSFRDQALDHGGLSVMPIVRQNVPDMAPTRFICQMLAEGLSGYTTTASGLRPHPRLYHVGGVRGCPKLTYANPTNKPRDDT